MTGRFISPDGIEYLGANVDVTDDQGKMAYDYAVENGHLQIAELLEEID